MKLREVHRAKCITVRTFARTVATTDYDYEVIHSGVSALPARNYYLIPMKFCEWQLSRIAKMLICITKSISDSNGTTIHLPRDFMADLYSRLNVPFDEDRIRLSHPIDLHILIDNITSQSYDASPSGVLTSRR